MPKSNLWKDSLQIPSVWLSGTGVYSRAMLWRFSSKKNNTVLKNRGAAIWKVRKFQPQVVVDIFRKLEDGIVPRMTSRQLEKKMKNVVYPCRGGGLGVIHVGPCLNTGKPVDFVTVAGFWQPPTYLAPRKKYSPNTAFGPTNGMGVEAEKTRGVSMGPWDCYIYLYWSHKHQPFM